MAKRLEILGRKCEGGENCCSKGGVGDHPFPRETKPIPRARGVGKGPSGQHYRRRLGRAEPRHHQLDAVSCANEY